MVSTKPVGVHTSHCRLCLSVVVADAWSRCLRFRRCPDRSGHIRWVSGEPLRVALDWGQWMATSARIGAYTSKGRAARTGAAATSVFPARTSPARAAAGRLRASQLPPGAPDVGTLDHSAAGMRPSQVPVGSVCVSSPLVQDKPGVTSPGEREAGDVADAVSGIVHRVTAGSGRTAVQRKCTECQDEEKKQLQAKSAPSRLTSMDAQRGASRVLDVVARGGGQPLAPQMRADMEAGFGADFSDVRIHTGAAAATSAAAVSAEAYTVGNEIVFGHGFFAPESPEGKHRLAHELAHVQQQRNGPVWVTGTGDGVAVSDPSDSFEQEAEAAASRVLSGRQTVAGDGSLPGAYDHGTSTDRRLLVNGAQQSGNRELAAHGSLSTGASLNLRRQPLQTPQDDSGLADMDAGTGLQGAAAPPGCAGWEGDPQSFSIAAARNFAMDTVNRRLSTPDTLECSGKV